MRVLDAVEQVLVSANVPLDYREITRRVLDSRLWHTNGLTPWATINAQLAVDIKNLGVTSRFQRTGKGIFALRKWGQPDFDRRGTRLNVHGQVQNTQPQDTFQSLTTNMTTSQESSLSFVDAAEQVLDLFAAKKPMHYREITQKALELGLLSTAGRTPEATLYTRLISENARLDRRGEPSRFVHLDRGYFALTRWHDRGDGIALLISQHNASVHKQLLDRLHSMLPGEFEILIGKLLAALGFEEIEVTSESGDGGIDVRGTLVVGDVIRTRMAVQVKRWKNNVQAPTVQQVRGALGTHEQGLIITTSDFSSGAKTEAERLNAVPVGLMSGEQLVALLVEHDISIRRTAYDLLELGSLVVEDE